MNVPTWQVPVLVVKRRDGTNWEKYPKADKSDLIRQKLLIEPHLADLIRSKTSWSVLEEKWFLL